MTVIRKSVPRPTGVGVGTPSPKGEVTVIFAADVLTFPSRDANGVKMLGNVVLLTGAQMYKIYASPKSQKASFETNGDEDNEGFVVKFEGSHPGDSLDYNEFVQNTLGQGVILIYGKGCGDNQGKVLGSPCNPMKLKASFIDDKDNKKHTLAFEQSYQDRYVPGFYDGVVSYAANYVSVDTSLDMLKTNGFVYQLPALAITAVITATSIDLNHGDVVSLIGGGGVAPATLASAVAGVVTVILANGTTWTGLTDAVINLQVFKAGATTYLIEQSRS